MTFRRNLLSAWIQNALYGSAEDKRRNEAMVSIWKNRIIL